ncbi:hypothetical protein FLONG3_5552 [Fusarium longipes]|uniref:Uncharacterized protein n=1 Tax=Fusarium longipes TaxID=694270 RepID=A0A395SV50_9HYPO|nr:hypothetical protein FLONG3_5552 [Fusarium longipes]
MPALKSFVESSAEAIASAINNQSSFQHLQRRGHPRDSYKLDALCITSAIAIFVLSFSGCWCYMKAGDRKARKAEEEGE